MTFPIGCRYKNPRPFICRGSYMCVLCLKRKTVRSMSEASPGIFMTFVLRQPAERSSALDPFSGFMNLVKLVANRYANTGIRCTK